METKLFKERLSGAIFRYKRRSLLIVTKNGEQVANNIQLIEGGFGFSFTVDGEPFCLDLDDITDARILESEGEES